MTAGLALDAPERVPLDEPLVVVARLENTGGGAVVTSCRLDLLEDDLTVEVAPPGGTPQQVVWPWPIDSARREATLAPGQRLEGGVLLHWGIGGPVFASAGRYTLRSEFTVSPMEPAIGSPSATVWRDDAGDPAGQARQQLLLDTDVGRSLASASVLGGAAAALAQLAATGAPVTRFLATMALGDPAAVAALATEADPVDVAAWTTAVLPAGLFATDPRLLAVAQVVSGDARAAAILAERPL